jgi:hypothetical protein
MTGNLFFGHNGGHYAHNVAIMDNVFLLYKNEQNHQKLAKKKQLDTFAQHLFKIQM